MPPTWKQFLPLPFTQPDDIDPETRSRLPYIRAKGSELPAPLYSRGLAPEGTGPTQLRRHGSAMKLLQASVGTRITALAALATAQEHHQPYHWRTTEAAAHAAGLDTTSIDIVHSDRALTGLPEKDAALIQFARELFRRHTVAPDTYGRALKLFGERDLVDLVDLMGVHATDAVLLTAFDQH